MEIKREKLKPGDHIFTNRTYKYLVPYDHHGIYVGDNMVIQFMGPSDANRELQKCGYKRSTTGVIKACLDCFLKGGKLYVVEYDVSFWKALKARPGSCCIYAIKPTNEVVREAYRWLEAKSFGTYDFVLNNCEDFAVFCTTGRAKSEQSAQNMGFLAYNIAKEIYRNNHPDVPWKTYVVQLIEDKL